MVPGTTTHHLTTYRASSGALVFSAGSVQWAWGLDAYHDGVDPQPADARMRQATANLLADMGALPETTAADLTSPTKSTDTAAPAAVITAPNAGSNLAAGDLITVEGTATDAGGGRVAAVEVSVDGGATFHPATGRETFSYTGVLTGTGPSAIQARAVDDSANLQASPTRLPVTAACPCSIFGALTPTNPTTADGSATTLGTRFTSAADGFITGIRFYKGDGNGGTHTGTLYAADGQALATARFVSETASGWQTVNFSSAVPVTAGTPYVAAYLAPAGHYAADTGFFGYRGFSSGRLTAPGGTSNPNGVFANGDSFPQSTYKQTNYYVDAVFNETDTTPLTVTDPRPLGDSSSVALGAVIRGTFSRTADPSTVTMSVLDGDGRPVRGNVAYNATSKAATFTPDQPLAPSTGYTVTLTATSTSGVGMAAPYQWSFTTAAPDAVPGVCPCTLFDDSDAPPRAPESDASRTQVGVAFTSTTAGAITGIRFYKGPGNDGPHTVSLWSGTTELASATPATESSAGWQSASFASPVAIDAGKTYVASYLAPSGHYSAEPGGLADKITRAPLATVADGGRYTYGAGAPTSVSSANYFVDPVFTESTTAAPEVVKTSPGDDATSVPVTGHFTVTFNASVQPGSVDVTVKRAGDGASVPGSTGSETSGSSVSFVPAAPLDPGTKYTVAISGARSTGGTPMSPAVSRTFTTAGAQACPCSLMETTTEPANPDSGDGGATTLGLKFRSVVDGSIKGLRFYRDQANTGTHVGKLWTADGSQLASVTFTNSGTGWQTATFSDPVPIEAGTTYVASYYAPQGHYSAASGYFATPVVNSPLSSVGAGGVYANGNNFPDATYQNTNYYVDVVFSTENAAPPTVSTVSPADGGTAAVTAPVRATFKRGIDPSTLSMAVTGPDDIAVSGEVTYDSDSSTATFQPSTDLAPATAYTATVTANSLGGVAMAAPKTWSFTTRTAAPVGQQVSLFSSTDVPATAAWDDPDPVTVGVRFSSAKDGTVTAIRFYAGPGNTGGQTVNLWDAGGTSLASATASGSSVGWRTVTLDEPVPITAGQTYTASYRAPTGHYSVTANAFAQPVTKGPLTVPAGGGTYRYTSGPPTATANTNYWVDVIVTVPN